MLRDHMGVFRAAACHCFDGITDPEVVEIKACKRAIQVAPELNTEKLHLELDNVSVVKMINGPAKNISSSGPCIEEIKEMLKAFQEVIKGIMGEAQCEWRRG